MVWYEQEDRHSDKGRYQFSFGGTGMMFLGKTKHWYTLALEAGGIPEYEGRWEYQNLLTVDATSLRRAKTIWAKKTGHYEKKDWDKRTQSYWGWSVVCLGTNDPRVDCIRVEKDG
jgi:hypothetical protein